MTDGPALVEIRLLRMSLRDYRESAAHHDELFREFALIRGQEAAGGHDVPARLLSFVEELNERFSNFSAGAQGEIAKALERGEETIDLTYRVPPETREATTRFAELLARADQYCRQGALLTIAPPPDAVVFRNWFLGEFATQIDGSPPTPWPEYRARVASPS